MKGNFRDVLSSSLSSLETRIRRSGNKTARLRSEPVYGSRGGNIQSLVIGVSPCQIGRYFGQHDGSQVLAVRVPHPDALWTSNIKIAHHIHSHAVRNTVLSLFLSKLPSVDRESRPVQNQILAKHRFRSRGWADVPAVTRSAAPVPVPGLRM